MNQNPDWQGQPDSAVGSRRRLSRRFLIVAVLGSIFTACSAGAAYFYIDASNNIPQIEAVVQDFVAALSEGQVDRAASHLAQELRSDAGIAELRHMISATTDLADYQKL